MAASARTAPGFVENFSAPHFLSALPDFAIAAVFATAWVRPASLPPERIRLLLVAMILEFIVVHSGAMLGGVWVSGDSRRSQSGMFAVLAAFYSIFALAFSLAFHTWWPLFSFWGLMVNRFLIVLLDPRPRPEKQRLIMTNWGLTTVAYLGSVFFTTIAPIPRMGFDSEVVRSLHLTGGGLWIDEPWRVMALGAMYYTLVGLVQLFVIGPMSRRTDLAAPASPGASGAA